ncbi:3-hydroxyisobutyrate dehydrogenase [Polymorphobacter multimanifer]|uniref:3-hydroxyisobutyrate dehydrogenase n=1 Tax=Polymorphobacter multimanifer TaxID=1070431 RepID=A0A841L528_9SPHN|nr:NAD(P)-dependent oxidoreductase [Polymorphobacter multimanifer]MBB6227737.1 3-hydroxyisobutyrate dehydrogenase [Polymorphobacter multimanifer]
MKIGFLGLGVMGAPMARHLLAAGHEVAVWNRTHARAQAFVDAHGGRLATSPADAARGADVVAACVGADADVLAVTVGDASNGGGAFSGMRAGALFIDHTTASAEVARHLDEQAAARGLLWLDAPVSGGQAGAESGSLSVMCGGSEGAFAAAGPVLAAYGKTIGHIGPAGAGQLAKMVNQVAIAGVVQGLAEALAFGRAAGLDMEKVLGVIGGGAAASWQMHNRAPTMLAGKFDFGFAVDWMRKDLGLVLAEAARLGVELPVTELVDGYYAEVQAMGGGRDDTSSLIRRFPAG